MRESVRWLASSMSSASGMISARIRATSAGWISSPSRQTSRVGIGDATQELAIRDRPVVDHTADRAGQTLGIVVVP